MEDEETTAQGSVVRNSRSGLSRRKFVKFGAGFVGGLLIKGCVPRKAGESPISPSPLKTRLPDEPSASSLLQATRTVLEAEGRQHSFVEEGEFTEKLFEKVRRGTFLLSLKCENGNPLGTGWLAKREGDTYYIASNKHLLARSGGIQYGRILEIEIWRPGLDKNGLTIKEFKIIPSPRELLDVAVMKFNGTFNTQAPLEELNWQDAAELEAGKDVLIVGFPLVFGEFNRKRLQDYGTMASVVTLVEPRSHWKDLRLIALGLAEMGASGSPVVINQDGEPLVVGMVWAGSQEDQKVGPNTIQKKNTISITKLDIGKIMEVF